MLPTRISKEVRRAFRMGLVGKILLFLCMFSILDPTGCQAKISRHRKEKKAQAEPVLSLPDDGLASDSALFPDSSFPNPFEKHEPLAQWNLSIPELGQAKNLLGQGRSEEAVSLLEDALPNASDPAAIQEAIVDVLVLSANDQLKQLPEGPFSTPLAKSLEGIFDKAFSYDKNRLDLWKSFLTYLAKDLDQKERFSYEGIKLFVNHWVALSTEPVDEWLDILRKLEPEFTRMKQPLLRHEALQLLLRHPLTAGDAEKNLVLVVREIREKMLEITQDVETAITQGKMDEAGFALMVLDRIAPDSLPLKNAWDSFLREKNLQFCLSQGLNAVSHGEKVQALEFYRQALEIAPRDSRLASLREKLNQPIPETDTQSVELSRDMVEKKNRWLAELGQAEGKSELATAARLLENLQKAGLAEPEHLQKLDLYRFQLFQAKSHIAEKWAETNRVFRNMDWERLELLLNKNPCFNENPDYSPALMEMRFAVGYFLRKTDKAQLKREADLVLRKVPGSFYPQVANMEIALQEGNFAEATALLQKIQNLQPDHPSLKTAMQQLKNHQLRTWGLGFLFLGGIFVLFVSVHQIKRAWEQFSRSH